MPVNPDANVYGVALLSSLVSGLLFGAVPVKQVLRADPYQIVKSGSVARVGRHITARDALLAVQIAICAVLVTSSMVALRGLVRSLNANYGFQTRNTILLNTNLAMAGYSADEVPAMQRRMLDAMKSIPGVERVGLVNEYPPLVYAAGNRLHSIEHAPLHCWYFIGTVTGHGEVCIETYCVPGLETVVGIQRAH